MSNGDTPKVNKRGLLDQPYPIRTRGDVSRARVLPAPDVTTPRPESPKAPMTQAAPARDRSLDRPKSGFDYVSKRNRLQREIQGRR